MSSGLTRSQALWNRDRLDLASDEILAQILDRGSLQDWRELYALASADPDLRRRIAGVVRTVPIAFPGLWLSALASLSEPVDWSVSLPEDFGI